MVSVSQYDGLISCGDLTRIHVILVASFVLAAVLLLAWLYHRGIIDRLRSELVIVKSANDAILRSNKASMQLWSMNANLNWSRKCQH